MDYTVNICNSKRRAGVLLGQLWMDSVVYRIQRVGDHLRVRKVRRWQQQRHQSSPGAMDRPVLGPS